MQVNVANYDVTQKGYTGANINAVTKSGTNTYKGGVYYVFRNDNLAGDRYNPITDVYSDAPKFKETTKGVWASGPLIQDKLFFFALAEELRELAFERLTSVRSARRRHHRRHHPVGHRRSPAHRPEPLRRRHRHHQPCRPVRC